MARAGSASSIVSVAATMALAACAAAPPEPLQREERRETAATVTAVYPSTRLVSVLTEDGRPLTLHAGDAIRNFADIGVGDRVTTTYYEAVAAEVTDAPAGGEPPVLLKGRAAEGKGPGASRGRLLTGVVTVEAVDTVRNKVRISGPQGWPTEITVSAPESVAFINGLEPGDRVMLTYAQAEAVSITSTSVAP